MSLREAQRRSNTPIGSWRDCFTPAGPRNDIYLWCIWEEGVTSRAEKTSSNGEDAQAIPLRISSPRPSQSEGESKGGSVLFHPQGCELEFVYIHQAQVGEFEAGDDF